MGNITLSLPDDLHERMKRMSDIKWSEVARRAIEQKVNDLETLNKLASKSRLSDKDIEEISKKIKSSAANRFNDSCNRH
jgi:predicted CopG family antitoxin